MLAYINTITFILNRVHVNTDNFSLLQCEILQVRPKSSSYPKALVPLL